jgi:hypothetical protein
MTITIIIITIITDNRLQVRSFPDTAGTALWRAVGQSVRPSVQQNATLQQRLRNCRAKKNDPKLNTFKRLWCGPQNQDSSK